MFIYLSTQSWVITDLFCMQAYFFLPILISGQGLNLKLLTLTLLQNCFKTHNWYLYSLFLFCLFPILGLFSCSILPLLGTSCDSWNKFWLFSDLTFWSWWQIFQLLVRIWDHYRLLRKCISSTYWWTSEDAGIAHVFKNLAVSIVGISWLRQF